MAETTHHASAGAPATAGAPVSHTPAGAQRRVPPPAAPQPGTGRPTAAELDGT